MTAILKKMHEVMKDLGYIQKDSRNAHQNYNYASEKAIKEAFGKAFRAKGIVFHCSQDPVYAIGNTIFVPFRYAFIDVETGEKLEGTFHGSGHTRDDKGYYAAVTGAIKYILTSNFLITTGDDAENAAQTRAHEAETMRQAAADERAKLLNDISRGETALMTKKVSFNAVESYNDWGVKELKERLAYLVTTVRKAS